MSYLDDYGKRIISNAYERKNPSFSIIVTFNFYDGIDDCLGIYKDGIAVLCRAIGESKYRTFKAFRFDLLEGNWLNTINNIIDGEIPEFPITAKPFFPDMRGADIALLEKKVINSSVHSQYIGVGSPYLEWITAFPASRYMIEEATLQGYRYVHELLKRRV